MNFFEENGCMYKTFSSGSIGYAELRPTQKIPILLNSLYILQKGAYILQKTKKKIDNSVLILAVLLQ